MFVQHHYFVSFVGSWAWLFLTALVLGFAGCIGTIEEKQAGRDPGIRLESDLTVSRS